MDMEHIKPSTVSTFCAILYSPTHLLLSFIDRHILMVTIATYTQLWKTMKENNTRHDSDDAASQHENTHINELDINKCRLLINTL